MQDSQSHPDRWDTPEALAFQRTSWRVQRVGWCTLGLILVLATLGAFGGGPLSRTTARSADASLSVRYQRVWRMESPATLEFTARPDRNGDIDLALDGGFLAATSLGEMLPEPARVTAFPGGQRFHFRADDRAPVTLRLILTAHRMGRLRTRVTGPGGQAVVLSLFVLP